MIDPTGPIAIGFVAVNFLLGLSTTIHRLWQMHKQQKQMKSMNQQINTIKEAVVPEKEDLDSEIDKVLNLLSSAPTQQLYQQIMALLFKKRDNLLSTIEFKDVVEYMAKCKAIAEQFEIMFQKVEEILKEKGVQVQIEGAGTGLEDNIPGAPSVKMSSAPRVATAIVETVPVKKSFWCC